MQTVSGYTKMQRLYIVILLVFSTISLDAQPNSFDVRPYDFDTTLKGGYTISFLIDDSLQYLYLKRGNKTITELASSTRGLPYKNLGYVVTDFKDYFVLAHSFGSGNPHNIELIKKSTGINILDKNCAWIDAIEEKDILLYCENKVPTKKDKMVLHNLRTGTKEFYSFPLELLKETEIFSRIVIVRLTSKEFVVSYYANSSIKIKTYSR